jgi:rhodanese-related sulfurtransferase
MFGDNSKEALGLTLNYNKPPYASWIYLVSGAKAAVRRTIMGTSMALPFEITPTEVKHLIDAGEELSLLDIREPEEHQICQLPGATLIPMREVSKQFDRLEEVPMPLIVFCHHGVRSMMVVAWLREQGLMECQSMAGGIDQWSREIDPKVPRY